MRIVLNDKEIIFPSSLSEITLGQRIAFYETHGRELDQMLDTILKMEDDVFKEAELSQFHMEKMVRTFAFFAGVTPEAVKDEQYIDQIAGIYYSSLSVLIDDEANMEYQDTFFWKGEEWILYKPELKHGDKMKFGEFIDSKQVVQNMVELGRGKWEYMLPLCAIYLRKKDEDYQVEFLYEGSDRMELMKSLPMDIALQVGFFLTACLNLFMNTLQSSTPQEQKEVESTLKSISKSGVG